MNGRFLKFGFLIGLVGGGAMALFAMTAMWATGRGFFSVVNLFAHTFWSDAPLDGTFVLAAFGLGLLIHLVMSTLVGTIIAWLVVKGQLDAGIIVLVGVGIGSAVWVVQAFAWTAIDADAHQQFTPWILATAHVVFALGAATFLTWLEVHEVIDRAAASEPARESSGVSDRLVSPPPRMSPQPTRSGFSRSAFSRPERPRFDRLDAQELGYVDSSSARDRRAPVVAGADHSDADRPGSGAS